MGGRDCRDRADIQKDPPILVVVRDNAGENTSKELNDYFTERGIKNGFQHTLQAVGSIRKISHYAWEDGDG